MKPTIGRLLSLTGVVIAITPMSVRAQDFFRDLGTSRTSGGIGPVTPSEYTYQDISPLGLESLSVTREQKEEEANNFQIGPVRFSMAAGIGVEFNDNITLAQTGRQSDIIIRPSFDVNAIWHLSDINTLRLSLAIGYAKYVDHSEYDTKGVLISPTSELEYIFMLGNVKFTARDRGSYQEDPYSIELLSGVARYRRYENQIGIKAEVNLNASTSITVGYDHYNLWAVDKIFEDQSRAIDTVYLKPAVGLTPSIKVGLNTSYSRITFDSSDRPSGNAYFAGPFIEWQITQNTNLYAEGGFEGLHYDGSYKPTQFINSAAGQIAPAILDALGTVPADNTNSNSYYFRLELNNKPSESFQQRLSASKTTEVGFFSNNYQLYHVEYSADWTAMEKLTISPAAFYEHYDTSGALGESADRIGLLLGFRYHLTNSITLGLDYRYLWKTSNLPGADYYQNLLFLSAYYKF
jgi:opacity protein-like surface antigen